MIGGAHPRHAKCAARHKTTSTNTPNSTATTNGLAPILSEHHLAPSSSLLCSDIYKGCSITPAGFNRVWLCRIVVRPLLVSARITRRRGHCTALH